MLNSRVFAPGDPAILWANKYGRGLPIAPPQQQTATETKEEYVMETATTSSASPEIAIPKKRKRVRLVYSQDKKAKTKCHVCGKRMTKGGLALHHQSYHGNVAYQCTICEKGFVRLTNVKQHIRKLHHGMDQEWYTKRRKDELPAHVLEDMINRQRLVANSAYPVGPAPVFMKVSTFNCYDCDGSFPSVKELFAHCETHRVSETGEKLPYLVKTVKHWSNVYNRWMYK